MAATEDGVAITSGNDYTFNGGQMAADFKKNTHHSISISGSGSATIVVNFPSGGKSAGALSVAGSDVFYYPAIVSVEVTAVSDDIVVDFYSYEGRQ